MAQRRVDERKAEEREALLEIWTSLSQDVGFMNMVEDKADSAALDTYIVAHHHYTHRLISVPVSVPVPLMEQSWPGPHRCPLHPVPPEFLRLQISTAILSHDPLLDTGTDGNWLSTLD
jgi:hypothetical protein